MPFQLAIFDLDGVIVSTADYHYLAWKRLGQELGFEFTKEQNEELKGVSRDRSLEILLEIGKLEKTKEEKAELAARKNNWYLQYISEMGPDRILPGVVPFLTELKEKGKKTALGSASKNAPLVLKRIELENYFDVIVDGNLVVKAKPNPEVFLRCAALLGIKPDRAVVFEDAPAGIEAGLRAGMITVGIGSAGALPGAHLVLKGFSSLNLDKFRQLLESRINRRD
ncbi:MAG: beta-phosphoglucomutase [Firmicutes bacterium]|nr:beta-phosphoglucomutase [Bacillota bacterium]